MSWTGTSWEGTRAAEAAAGKDIRAKPREVGWGRRSGGTAGGEGRKAPKGRARPGRSIKQQKRNGPRATDRSIRGGPGRNNKAPWTGTSREQRSSREDEQEHPRKTTGTCSRTPGAGTSGEQQAAAALNWNSRGWKMRRTTSIESPGLHKKKEGEPAGKRENGDAIKDGAPPPERMEMQARTGEESGGRRRRGQNSRKGQRGGRVE